MADADGQPIPPAAPTLAAPTPAAAAPVEAGVAEPQPVLQITVASAAPLAKPAPLATAATGQAPQVLGLPLQFLNQLLQKLGATPLRSLADLLPALQILALALLAGIALKLTGATLGAINELPLVGGLLELVGLVALLNAVARNAFKQQKRAELLERIRQLRKDLLG